MTNETTTETKTDETEESRKAAQTDAIWALARTIDATLVDSLRSNTMLLVSAGVRAVIGTVESKETARLIRLWRIFETELVHFEMSIVRRFRNAGGMDAIRAIGKVWEDRLPALKGCVVDIKKTVRPHPAIVIEMGKLMQSRERLDAFVEETMNPISERGSEKDLAEGAA